MEGTEKEDGTGLESGKKQTGLKGFWAKNGPVIVLVILILYVILLGIGVTAEVFKIQWILDWWIWSPPGK